MVTSDF